jgi:hypothetical protein
MQSLPLVSGALRVYEAGKANSRVVQVRTVSLQFSSQVLTNYFYLHFSCISFG